MRKHTHKDKKPANIWQIQEAKAKFSEVIENAAKKHQTITKNGEPVAVILSIKEYDELAKPKSSLLDFFKSAPCQDVELDIERSKELPRDFDL